jgi:hypothetical protein
MLPRCIRVPLARSPLITLAVELMLAAATVASTGGGDFPRVRALLTVL